MIGQRVSNFEVVGLLAEGAMGTVYEARHPQLDRTVAVKVLKAEQAAHPQAVQRFLNEAWATAANRHPNIVEVVDLGTLPDGAPYLVMEKLDGETLAKRIARYERLGVVEAIEIARQTASALEAAHGRGIVHRDLKPENLFIARDARSPDRELVKVLDFGIAKLRDEIERPGPVATMSGVLLGTPRYMSPEQCRGTPHDVDERSDVYALGVILFEMLAGTPPFDAEALGDLIIMHMSTPPPALSELRQEVVPELEHVVRRALAKRPDERMSDMGEFQALLFHALQATMAAGHAEAEGEGVLALVAGDSPLSDGRRLGPAGLPMSGDVAKPPVAGPASTADESGVKRLRPRHSPLDPVSLADVAIWTNPGRELPVTDPPPRSAEAVQAPRGARAMGESLGESLPVPPPAEIAPGTQLARRPPHPAFQSEHDRTTSRLLALEAPPPSSEELGKPQPRRTLRVLALMAAAVLVGVVAKNLSMDSGSGSTPSSAAAAAVQLDPGLPRPLPPAAAPDPTLPDESTASALALRPSIAETLRPSAAPADSAAPRVVSASAPAAGLSSEAVAERAPVPAHRPAPRAPQRRKRGLGQSVGMAKGRSDAVAPPTLRAPGLKAVEDDDLFRARHDLLAEDETVSHGAFPNTASADDEPLTIRALPEAPAPRASAGVGFAGMPRPLPAQGSSNPPLPKPLPPVSSALAARVRPLPEAEAPTPDKAPATPPEPLGARALIRGLQVAGSLPTSVVRRAVERERDGYARCYRKAAERAGRNVFEPVHIDLEIDLRGRANDVRAGSHALPGLSSCVRGAAADMATAHKPDLGTVSASFDVSFER